MSQTNQKTLDHVLDETESLSFDEREMLLEILQKRLLESRRVRLAQDIREAGQEFAKGQCGPTDAESLFKEIDS